MHATLKAPRYIFCLYIHRTLVYTRILMHTRNLTIAGVVLVLMLSAYFALRYTTTASRTSDFNIATSFYPIYFLTSTIVGSTSTVFTVTPFDTEPHEYEPTPKVLANILASTLFIHTGGALEPWAERVVTLRQEKEMPSLALITDENGIINMETTEKHSDDEHEQTASLYDPHIWLSPAHAINLVTRIATELIRINPAAADVYTAHAATLTQELTALDTAYRTTLAQCATHTLVTDHDAFGYIAADYGLITMPIRGISPEDEPTPQTLAVITNYVHTHHVAYILTEELVSPAVADTIARETGAKTAQLATIEGLTEEDAAHGATYLTKLRDNLATLSTALQCR